jgi:hypothetical protein
VREKPNDHFAIGPLAQAAAKASNVIPRLRWADDDVATLWGASFFGCAQRHNHSDWQTVRGKTISMAGIVGGKIDGESALGSETRKFDCAIAVLVCVRETTAITVCFNEFSQCHAVDIFVGAGQIARDVESPKAVLRKLANFAGQLVYVRPTNRHFVPCQTGMKPGVCVARFFLPA